MFLYLKLADVKVGGETKGLSNFIRLPGVLILLMVLLATDYGICGFYNMIGDWVVQTVSIECRPVVLGEASIAFP